MTTTTKDAATERPNLLELAEKALEVQILRARVAELEANLRGRDDFIVSKGIWSEFMDGLPRGVAQGAATSEPDAWQRRIKDRYGKWQDWVDCSADPVDQQRWRNIGCEIRPLYASPPHSGQMIESKPAERWEVGKNGWDASDEATREDI